MPEILHITAHLGGGVGKVLSRLVEESSRRCDGFRHVVACLEKPEKDVFSTHLASHGGELLICPRPEELDRRIRAADIVQIEWWHHPLVARWLGEATLPPSRLVVWSHVSGLHPPTIPADFVTLPHRFLLTSPCSLESAELKTLPAAVRQRVDAVFSSGGFSDLPPPNPRSFTGPLRAGYVGTLNFAKLHPRILDFLGALKCNNFRLDLIGDLDNGDALQQAATAAGLGDCLKLLGYIHDVGNVLKNYDIFVYLLNPLHYGTTENALLEAMAMGVVPIVLNNPAERNLVQHMETGLIVNSPDEFADAVAWMSSHAKECRAMSMQAAAQTRQRFAIGHTLDKLTRHYRAVLTEDKRPVDFRPVFGTQPGDWFRRCQGEESWRFTDQPTSPNAEGPHFLFERNKSSVFHYARTFPDDLRLARWAQALETPQ